MTLALLAASAVGAVWLTALAVLPRMPRRLRCPSCGGPTAAVLPPALLAPGRRWLTWRWCPDCSWQGVGRKGPEPVPGLILGHVSGFAWGPGGSDGERGFDWADASGAGTRPDRPSHPSGFRFAPSPARPSPRGFRFRGAQPREGRRTATPSFGWRWRAAPVFGWRSACASAGGFRWAGAAGTDPSNDGDLR